MAKTVEFFGESFTLADSMSGFALWEYAEAVQDIEAEEDGSSDRLNKIWAANYRLLRDIVVVKDWARFTRTAKKNRASGDDLNKVFLAYHGQVEEAGNPTGEPADSSSGLSETDPKSDASFDAKASEAFPGRPDLQLAVKQSRAS